MTLRKHLTILAFSTALLLATGGCQDRVGADSKKEMQAETEAVQVARAATEWIRENQFVRHYPDSLPVKSHHVKELAGVLDQSIEMTRRDIRRNHCVGCSSEQRVDPEAFAITWPVGSYKRDASRATIRAAKGLAGALNKPSGVEGSFLSCTGQIFKNARPENCEIQGNVQSLLSFEELKVNGSNATVQVLWLYEGDHSGLAARRMRDMKLLKSGGVWRVQGDVSPGIF
ncbi:MAG: hypothetical protein ABEL04_02000 [Salinibacter sp.]|uniref:hypothetical protein n=1 Tax=Salinibacter sp. TaxID=2065818 RepID=UPI0035D4E6A8